MAVKRNDVFVFGTGHGGCQIAYSIAAKEICKCNFANSAMGDLSSLDGIEDDDKLHFQGGLGSGSDREIGKQYARDNMEDVFSRIDRTNAKHIYIIAAAAGGTGSGSGIEMARQIGLRYSPYRTELEREEQGLTEIPDKLVHVIGIMPNEFDNIGILGYQNALEFLKELSELFNQKIVCSYTFIDNGANPDKTELNEQFASDFEEFLSIPMHTSGFGKAIDLKDMHKAMSARGMFQFAEFSLVEENPDCVNIHSNNYFPKFVKGCEYLITTSSSEDETYVQNIRKHFGEATKQVKAGFGINNRNMAYAFGMKFPQTLVDQLKKLHDKLKSIIENQINTPSDELDFTFEKIESDMAINISDNILPMGIETETSYTSVPVKKLSPIEARAAKLAKARALKGK